VTPDESLSYIVSNLPIATKAPIELIRNGKRMTVTAEIGQRPPEEELANFAQPGEDDFSDQDQQTSQQASQQLLGVAVTELTPAIARQLNLGADVKGVVISAVDQSTDAGAKGLRRGDVIMLANGQPVSSEADLGKVAKAAKDSGRNAVLLQVLRRGSPATFVAIRLREK
jgi:serine protease Do